MILRSHQNCLKKRFIALLLLSTFNFLTACSTDQGVSLDGEERELSQASDRKKGTRFKLPFKKKMLFPFQKAKEILTKEKK